MKKILGLVLLSGCMVGPDYEPPVNNVSNEWSASADETPIVDDWWDIFNEPLLTQYIQKAVTHNKDVLAAEANVLQAVALKQVAASSLFPQINADYNGTKTYFSKNGPIFAIGPATGSLPGAPPTSQTTGLPFALQIPQVQNLWNFLFNVTWEVDLFGKNRRGVEAAKASIGSAIEQRNDILLSVMAQIANNYIQLRSNQKQALLLEENVELLQSIVDILQESLKAGYIDQLNFESAQAELLNAKAQIPTVIAQCYQNIYAISVLTGESPETLLPELLPVRPLPSIPHQVAVGIRSEILRRRPDVRYAERQLAAATANIGVAVGNFFPAFTLFGDGGLQSLNLNNLFNWQSRTWAFGGDLMTPLYQGGQLFGNLHASQAARTFAAESYQKVVLTALQEAEKFLMAYNQDLKTVVDLRGALQKNRIMLDITLEQFDKGLVNRIRYLNMGRQYVAAEQSLVNSQTVALSDLISLYKALGGGWEQRAEESVAE